MSFSYVGFHIFWDPTSFSQFTPSFWRSIFFTSFPRKVNQDLNFIKMSIFYPDMSLTILPSIDFQDRHFPQNFEGVSASSSGFSGAVEKFHATLVLIPLSSFFFALQKFLGPPLYPGVHDASDKSSERICICVYQIHGGYNQFGIDLN